jgi:hypothetical protein
MTARASGRLREPDNERVLKGEDRKGHACGARSPSPAGVERNVDPCKKAAVLGEHGRKNVAPVRQSGSIMEA